MGIGSAVQFGLIGGIVLAFGLAVWLAIRSIRKRGEQKAQLNQAKQSAGRAQDAAKIDEDVARADLDDLDDELRRD